MLWGNAVGGMGDEEAEVGDQKTEIRGQAGRWHPRTSDLYSLRRRASSQWVAARSSTITP
jgi:hypothetical protein